MKIIKTLEAINITKIHFAVLIKKLKEKQINHYIPTTQGNYYFCLLLSTWTRTYFHF